MDGNMIKTYEWDDEKLYGQLQALKNQWADHAHIGSDQASAPGRLFGSVVESVGQSLYSEATF